MPYHRKEDLPESVRKHLPSHALDIYLKAFNSAWDGYSDPDSRRGNESREAVTHKVAWAAVKQQYHKDGDRWVRQSD